MPKDILIDDFSPQLLAQTSQNMNKLFELSTRIDERVKNIQNKQEEFEEKLENSAKYTNELVQRLIVVEQRNGQTARDYVEEVRKGDGCR
jgi:predicted component of type VI protein secretion system